MLDEHSKSESSINDTNNVISLFNIDNFTLWLPSMEGAPNITGKFKFITETDDPIEILPKQNKYHSLLNRGMIRMGER